MAEGQKQWPDPSMGTAEEAEAKLVAAVDAWLDYRQPFMGTPAEHKRREIQEVNARFALANAAAYWAYFKRDPAEVVSRAQAENGGKG